MASPMAPEILTGYVALSSADKKAFDDLGELRPEIFDRPGILDNKHALLDATAEDAVETALLQCTMATFEVTASDTTWHVLKVSFAGKVIEDMCSAGELHRSVAERPLELRSPIRGEWLRHEIEASPKVEVVEVALPKMSFEDWGDRVLSASWSLQKSTGHTKCEDCPHGGRFAWKAEDRFGGEWFCAECWHGYCLDAGYIPESLHDVSFQRKALPGSEADVASYETPDSLWHPQDISIISKL